MGDDPALEHAVLQQLRFGPRNRTELAQRAGADDQRVQVVLDELLSRSHIVRRPQDIGLGDYELTRAGVVEAQGVVSQPVAVQQATVAPRKRRPPTRRPRPRRSQVPLTQEDREHCDLALTQLYVHRRIDKTELARRADLLTRASTRGDLREVFEGLPFPVLDLPPAPAGPQKAVVQPAKIAAEPAAVDRELIVNLAKSLVAGLVFTGIVIVTRPSMVILLAVLVVTAGNMFSTYRTWAKKRRSE
ncbi:DUF1707 domain-containing protein [Kribbella sp. NBC_00709]|uniref:hypothetical protein n=1 Tax=Kribbella sp. NBC_00709 TaxID=2975972 RepID=UPI002E2D3F7C|nr:hypothetical protein [Kribbella sp. NBC_00709]